MSKMWIIRAVVCLVGAVLMLPAVAQTTLTVENSTVTNTNVSVYQVTPTQGLTQIYTLFQDQAANTKIPANGNTLISVQMQQANANVADTPVLMANVRLANLMSSCGAAIPPCLYLTPATTFPGTEEANRFLAERSKTKEFCMIGEASTRNSSRYFALQNGLVVRLMGTLTGVPAKGRACLCGVVGTPPEPLDTIAFEVKSACPEDKKTPKKE